MTHNVCVIAMMITTRFTVECSIHWTCMVGRSVWTGNRVSCWTFHISIISTNLLSVTQYITAQTNPECVILVT